MIYVLIFIITSVVIMIILAAIGSYDSFDAIARKKGYVKKSEVDHNLVMIRAKVLLLKTQYDNSLKIKENDISEYVNKVNSLIHDIEATNAEGETKIKVQLTISEQIEILKLAFNRGEISPSEYENRLNKLLDQL